jgi:hypothetical protein
MGVTDFINSKACGKPVHEVHTFDVAQQQYQQR